MSVFRNNPRKSLSICPERRCVSSSGRAGKRGARVYSTRLCVGEISWTKSRRYREITALAADPDAATPLAAPPRLAPDVLP